MCGQMDDALCDVNYKARLLLAMDDFVRKGHAEWVEKGARDLPDCPPELNPFFVLALKVK